MDDTLRRQARGARAEIEAGTLRGEALLARLAAVPFRERDAWVDEMLGIGSPPDDGAELPRGAVPYLPCGVDEIMAMVRDVPLGAGDVFVDLGAGVGRVAILVHLLTGVRAHGIEIQRPLVDIARSRSAELGLTGADVSFEHADAATSTLAGSVFFLYTPFNGAMLASALGHLEEVARRRAIVVCTVGLELRDVPWLRARSATSVSLSVYDSRG